MTFITTRLVSLGRPMAPTPVTVTRLKSLIKVVVANGLVLATAPPSCQTVMVALQCKASPAPATTASLTAFITEPPSATSIKEPSKRCLPSGLVSRPFGQFSRRLSLPFQGKD